MDKKKSDDDENEPKKKGKTKLLAGLLVVVALGGGFGYMKFLKKAKHDPTGTAPAGPITVENSLTVNLRDGHYLQFTAAIQTYPGKSDKVLTKDQALVLDVLNAQAQDMTEPELLAPGGAKGLKASIVASLNRDWPGLVEAVYFEQFVMQ